MKAILFLPVICVFLLVLSGHGAHSLEFNTEMDWYHTRLHITISRAIQLPGGQLAPSSHPQALRELQREIPALVQQELMTLPWNHRGDLGYLAGTNRKLRKIMTTLTNSTQRVWSRLSLDGKAIEARYSLDMSRVLTARQKIISDGILPPAPLGWTPVPDVPWTGLVVYVPPALAAHGEEGLTSLTRVIYPRILSEDMDILINISPEGDFVIPYLALPERERSQEIVGNAPYRTMARSLRESRDIIINREDSSRLLASPSGRKLLQEGRVVILLETSSSE